MKTRADLFDWLPAQMAEHHVPAVSIAFLDAGEVIPVTFGPKISDETLFQAASISKAVSAAGALRMVADGRLHLDEDVNPRLTAWKVRSVAEDEESRPTTISESMLGMGGWEPRVTLRQILSHTSGLTGHGFPGYSRDAPIPSLTEILEGAGPANTPPVRVDILPGLQWRYSGGGYIVLQLLLSEVSDQPFHELMHDLVLEPAGMKSSTFDQPLDEARQGLAAPGHRPDGSMMEGSWQVMPERAAAGLWTTAGDLVRFAGALQRSVAGETNALIPAGLAREALSPAPSTMGSFGLGFGLSGTPEEARFGHGGGNEGYRCDLLAYRNRKLACAVMTNSDAGDMVMAPILDAVAQEQGWPGYAPHPPRPSNEELLGRFRGTYASADDAGLRIVVETVAEPLGLQLAVPGQSPVPLQYVNLATWTVAGLKAEVEFDLPQDGGPARGIALRQHGGFRLEAVRETEAP